MFTFFSFIHQKGLGNSLSKLMICKNESLHYFGLDLFFLFEISTIYIFY